MPRVKFLADTVHPDYGAVEKGEVLAVPEEYARDYAQTGVAEELDEDENSAVSREEPEGATQWEVHQAAVDARRGAATRTVDVGGEQGAPRAGAKK